MFPFIKETTVQLYMLFYISLNICNPMNASFYLRLRPLMGHQWSTCCDLNLLSFTLSDPICVLTAVMSQCASDRWRDETTQMVLLTQS